MSDSGSSSEDDDVNEQILRMVDEIKKRKKRRHVEEQDEAQEQARMVPAPVNDNAQDDARLCQQAQEARPPAVQAQDLPANEEAPPADNPTAAVGPEEAEEGNILEIDRLIASMYKDNKGLDASGPNISAELAESVDSMCWKIYSDSELNSIMNAVAPPANVRRLHPISVKERLEDNSPQYGRRLQSNLVHIHRLTQLSVVPQLLLMERSRGGVRVPNRTIIEKLHESVQLVTAACTRVTMLIHVVIHDGLPSDLRSLASRRHPVTDRYFGDSTEQEYQRLMTDKKDKAFFQSQYKQHSSDSKSGGNPESFLSWGGGGGTPTPPQRIRGQSQQLSQLLSKSLAAMLKDNNENQGANRSQQGRQRNWGSRSKKSLDKKQQDKDRFRSYKD